MKKRPEFLIIGAAKSGTTSLYFYLQQHPRIFLPDIKEPFFFAFENHDLNSYHYHGNMKGVLNAVTNSDDYQELFSGVEENMICGEASTLYLYLPEAAERISDYNPDTKLIAILRNPVDRAYSHFQYFRRDGFEPIDDFNSAVCAERDRMNENWFPSYFYLDAGFYSRQIKKYYQHFPKSQLKIFLYEDLREANLMVKEIFKFLDIELITPGDTTSRHNISGTVRFPELYRRVKNPSKVKSVLREKIPSGMWSRIRAEWEKVIITPSQPISIEYRRKLNEIYHDEILDLQELIKRDLSGWLQED